MTSACQVVYWRDIPAQVKVRSGRERLSRPLSDRFQRAVDEAAMRAGKSGTDEYLEQWRTSEAQEREGEPAAAAETLAAELEASYSAERLRALVANGGREG
jgi:hypothetical protein